MSSGIAARERAESARRLNEDGFCRWVGRADPGDVVEYHRGHLAVDRARETSRLDAAERRELGRTADRALRLAAEGRLVLVQRRLGPDGFSYLAIKTSGRPHGLRAMGHAPEAATAAPRTVTPHLPPFRAPASAATTRMHSNP